MVDPIVVTQLIKMRSELAGLAGAKRGELNAILHDLDHLDAVIKLFVPELPPVKRRASDRTFAPRIDAADLQHSQGSREADGGAGDRRRDRRGQGDG